MAVKKDIDKRVYVAKVLHAYKVPIDSIAEVVSYSEDVEKFYLAASKFVKKDFTYLFLGDSSSKAFDFSGLRGRDIDSLPLPFSGDFPPLKEPLLGKSYFLDYLKENKVRVIDYTQNTISERQRIRQLHQPIKDAKIEAIYAEKKEPMVIQSFSISKADKDILQKIADKNERSMGSLIRLIIKRHLKEFEHLHRS
jgi:predicted DNA-binding protein